MKIFGIGSPTTPPPPERRIPVIQERLSFVNYGNTPLWRRWVRRLADSKYLHHCPYFIFLRKLSGIASGYHLLLTCPISQSSLPSKRSSRAVTSAFIRCRSASCALSVTCCRKLPSSTRARRLSKLKYAEDAMNIIVKNAIRSPTDTSFLICHAVLRCSSIISFLSR